MRQKDPHFLFPQIYFGHMEPIDECFDPQTDELEEIDGCILLFDPTDLDIPHPKIGLHMHLF